MELFLYALGFILYLIIGRIVVEVKWGTGWVPESEADRMTETILWPFYLFAVIIKALVLFIVKLIYKIFNI